MQRFEAIFVFYKPFFVWSFLINILLIIVTQNISIVILTKLFLLILIQCFLIETKTKSKFLMGDNLDISHMKLLALAFLLDTLVTISFFKILKVFI